MSSKQAAQDTKHANSLQSEAKQHPPSQANDALPNEDSQAPNQQEEDEATAQEKANHQVVNPAQELSGLAPSVSIQDAFTKFRKEKFYQLKLNKYLKNIKVDRTSPEFKANLRTKLIETAHKYIGVPYAKKFHQEGDPLYSAPLFIDCCALIRQVVFDLKEEFGFTLAKWNQSYQFDLLPDEGLQEKDLQAGDLIFYSATYNNPKLKPFPHSMVHVEIYLGNGKSIGARWQKGTIKVFDSYKFQSTLYHDIKFHYRSIDKWLEGVFVSYCPEHKWLDERAGEWLSDKFSVFADPSLDQPTLREVEPEETKSVFVGKGNNSSLVKAYFTEKADRFALMPDKDQFSPHYYYKWVQTAGEVDFFSFKEGQQLVNHIPNITIISSKLELLKTLKQYETALKTQADSTKASPSNSQSPPPTIPTEKQLLRIDQFIPKTYRLDVMSDEIQFFNDNTPGIWIYKPRNLNQGRGIKLVSDIAQFKKEFIASKKFYLGQFALSHMIYYRPELDPTLGSQGTDITSKYSDLKHDGLIQHYIRPLCLRNRKFDIRCYLLVNSQPSVAVFHPGYLRLTLEDYTETDIEDESKLMVHLTNNCFQTKHKDYKQRKDESIANWELLQEEIGAEKVKTLKDKIKVILATVLEAAKPKLIAKKGTYELLGCDILVGSDYRPYLLEVNTNPALFTDTTVQKDMIPRVTRASLNFVLGLFEGQPVSQAIQTIQTAGFEPISS